MATEETETSEGANPAAPARAASPWPPVIAMLVLMPAISYGMTQLVLLPKLRGAAAEQKTSEASGKGEKGKSSGDAHGKGGDSKGQFTYDFDSVVVNLSGAMGTRYLKTSFTTLSANPDLKKLIDENKKQLLDVAITVLGSRSLADLEQSGAKNVVRNELMANFNQALKSDVIEQIYFSEFVVQ